MAFSADAERIYSASADGTIASWKRADGFLRPLIGHGWGINALARLPGSERLAFGGLDGSAAVIDVETGKVQDLPRHQRPLLALAVHERRAILATGGGDGVIRVLRSADNALVEEDRNPYGPGVGAGVHRRGQRTLLWRAR